MRNITSVCRVIFEIRLWIKISIAIFVNYGKTVIVSGFEVLVLFLVGSFRSDDIV